MNASIQEVFEQVEKPLENVSAQTLFGCPIETKGKTVVPVAKVSYKVVGGAKTGGHAGPGKDGAWTGGGGRIRGTATPFGALEITDEGTRFIPFMDVRRLVGAAAIAFIFGSLLGSRKHR